uniref:Putative zinc finger protein At4g06634-like isoform X2 n=1 Tax=Rhizophora mucronata TaxID=61149 RepID=A0A2P2MJ52_RHIMU
MKVFPQPSKLQRKRTSVVGLGSGSGAGGSFAFSLKPFNWLSVTHLKREHFPPVMTTSWGTHYLNHFSAGALDLMMGRLSNKL